MKRSTHRPGVLANQRHLAEREAHLRRFGYDYAAAIQFVLARALPLNGAVLEIGTGKGRFLVELARHAKRITTVDIAAEEQHSARLHARYAGVEKQIRFVLQDAARLPWPAATFDAAVTMNAMHHIKHFEEVLDEMISAHAVSKS
jgi:ubiquinone/menaquinone biosynthesis C-methylase UbiE